MWDTCYLIGIAIFVWGHSTILLTALIWVLLIVYYLDNKYFAYSKQDLMVNLMYIVTRRYQLNLSMTFLKFEVNTNYICIVIWGSIFVIWLVSYEILTISVGYIIAWSSIARNSYISVSISGAWDNFK
jgi:hypothetical protein